jgi:glycosyltransferase involved in cell wall biosynthesis
MRISAIVTLYNQRDYVGEALASILSQTRPAEEVIAVDDGSTDGGADRVAEFGERVRLFRQENRGPSAAINRGLSESTGEAVAFLDGDDLWTIDKLARQAPILAADATIDAVFAHIVQFTSPDVASSENTHLPPQPGISRITMLIRRTALDRLGYFDETRRASDFVPWYTRATVLGLRSIVLPEVLAYRRLHATNLGILQRGRQQEETLLSLKQSLDLRRALGGVGKSES